MLPRTRWSELELWSLYPLGRPEPTETSPPPTNDPDDSGDDERPNNHVHGATDECC